MSDIPGPTNPCSSWSTLFGAVLVANAVILITSIALLCIFHFHLQDLPWTYRTLVVAGCSLTILFGQVIWALTRISQEKFDEIYLERDCDGTETIRETLRSISSSAFKRIIVMRHQGNQGTIWMTGDSDDLLIGQNYQNKKDGVCTINSQDPPQLYLILPDPEGGTESARKTDDETRAAQGVGHFDDRRWVRDGNQYYILSQEEETHLCLYGLPFRLKTLIESGHY